MSPTISEQLQTLQARIRSEFTDARVELSEFPSGAAMLDVHRSGRAFVLSRSPENRFGVDELQPDDGFDSGYRFVFDEFDPAASQMCRLIEDAGAESVAGTTLNLVVIQAHDLEAAREFYRLLGLSFAAEKHGTGPMHYAATLGTTVFEIYPSASTKAAGPNRIGFQVSSVDRVISLLQEHGVKVVSVPEKIPRGDAAPLWKIRMETASS